MVIDETFLEQLKLSVAELKSFDECADAFEHLGGLMGKQYQEGIVMARGVIMDRMEEMDNVKFNKWMDDWQ